MSHVHTPSHAIPLAPRAVSVVRHTCAVTMASLCQRLTREPSTSGAFGFLIDREGVPCAKHTCLTRHKAAANQQRRDVPLTSNRLPYRMATVAGGP